jgi:catechol-2,3-dioxygenase
MGIERLNHAVLYVRDVRVTETFYREVLGFRTTGSMRDGRMVFMQAPASQNDHDVAFFSIGEAAGPSPAGRSSVGLYHLAWQVPTLTDLAEHRRRLLEAGALVGESDHIVSKSLYAQDPDGIEFEIMWAVPPELLDGDTGAQTLPLDLDRAIDRFGSDTVSSP